MKRSAISAVLILVCVATLVSLTSADADRRQPVIPNLPASPAFSASTVPANGDLNPYGVAFVPRDFREGGSLRPGDILVSNFNNAANLQGTGTTIVRITRDGRTAPFFQGNPGLGLTTALGVLKRGLVIVGSVPTANGTCTTGPGGQEIGVGQGALLILDRSGNVAKTLSDPALLDGPWDLAVRDRDDHAQVFVSNALSGAVTRIDLRIPESEDDVVVERKTQIASGYLHRCDPAALVVGPTGLVFDEQKNVLYVASTGDNAIFAIPDARGRNRDAGKGALVYRDPAHLRGPLALVMAPNGDLLTSNGDAVNPDPNFPSEIVGFTPQGQFVAQFSVDAAPGSAFGMAISSFGDSLRFAAVDDNLNVLDLWRIE